MQNISFRDADKRVEFIKNMLVTSGAKGIVFGNSGGKDCALAGILCRLATKNVIGVIMPCGSSRGYNEDRNDALALANSFDIQTLTVDITKSRDALLENIEGVQKLSKEALINIAPRLRMTTLYAIAHAKNYLVAGTGNRSERYMGYFTKWGDGACDFNPISDLTVSEIYDYLKYFGAPESIISKPPSAALYEGQTDEGDMGITYAELESYLSGVEINEKSKQIIERYHRVSRHKLSPIPLFKKDN